MNPDEFKDREGNMKGKFFSPVNIGLIVVLLIVSSLGQGDVAAGIGAVIVNVFIGLIFVGALLMGLFMFFYNMLKPDNKIHLGWPERVTAGLIGAVLWAVLTMKK